jgi:hypothetical protein
MGRNGPGPLEEFSNNSMKCLNSDQQRELFRKAGYIQRLSPFPVCFPHSTCVTNGPRKIEAMKAVF